MGSILAYGWKEHKKRRRKCGKRRRSKGVFYRFSRLLKMSRVGGQSGGAAEVSGRGEQEGGTQGADVGPLRDRAPFSTHLRCAGIAFGFDHVGPRFGLPRRRKAAEQSRQEDQGSHHVRNRAVARAMLFDGSADYTAFEKVLRQVKEWRPIRLLAYCTMPNHWHFVRWPQGDGVLSEFLRWLTVTHTPRWHAHRQARRRFGP
jgi:REP element-mobilizing transposase RayT